MRQGPLVLEGLVLLGPDLDPAPGRLYIEEDRISDFERRPGEKNQLIIPGLVNAHTHVGDCAFKDAGVGLSLPELVSSPDGLKHRLLAESEEGELERAIGLAENEMIRSGTTAFCDFREQGEKGVRILRRAVRRITALALGRPTGRRDAEGELGAIMQIADGVGLESVAKYDDGILELVRRAAGERLVAVHTLEGKRRDGEVQRALDTLGADFLVHMTYATEVDLEMVSDRGRAIVLCPRSNLELVSKAPPIDQMVRREIPLALGTDNCMVNSLNLFSEMELTLHLMREKDPRLVLQMATSNAAQILGLEGHGRIEKGMAADLVVLSMDSNLKGSRDIHAAVVKRAGPQNVSAVYKNGEKVL